MRFETSAELRLFADSVRGAVGGWEPPREPVFGTWWDEHDSELAGRVAEVGFAELWTGPALLGAAVAGGIELGRALVPLAVVDRATLGAALAVGGRARHLSIPHEVALVTAAGLVLAEVAPGRHEPTLDGTGTVLITEQAASVAAADGRERLRAWAAATLGYLAGVSQASLERTVAYVSAREQFGASLASLPTMQARLADASVAADGVELLAWESAVVAAADDPLPREALRFASAAAREVTRTAHQAYGGVGFALESGVHCAYRRVKSAQVWIAAVLSSTAR